MDTDIDFIYKTFKSKNISDIEISNLPIILTSLMKIAEKITSDGKTKKKLVVNTLLVIAHEVIDDENIISAIQNMAPAMIDTIVKFNNGEIKLSKSCLCECIKK